VTGSDSLSRSGPAPDRLRTVLGNGPCHSRAQIFTKSLLDKPPAGVRCWYQSLAQMARARWAYWGYFVMILIDRRSRGYRKGKSLALVVALVASIHLSPTALASPGESSKMAVASWAYNATAGVNYSNSYWWHRNPSYAQFGNDCANFLSQTLKSAGAPFLGAPTGSGSHNIPSQWWSNTSSWTNTWSVSENLRASIQGRGWHLFYSKYGAGAPNLIPGIGSARGLFVFYNWTGGSTASHSSYQVVANGIDQSPSPDWSGTLINQHTTDRWHAIWHLGPYNSQYATTRIWVYSL